MSKTLLQKMCSLILAVAMILSAGLTEVGTYIGTAVQVGAVTSSLEETPASSFEYEENEDGGITITKFIGDETNVVIPSKIDGKPVTSIGLLAFEDCKILTDVKIPNSVTSIGGSAFANCTSLKKVTIPNSVTNIGYGTFEDCTSLKKVEILSNVTKIENFTFYGCISLTNVTIPNSVTSIGAAAFSACKTLTDVTIPNSVTSIGSSAFYGCKSLKNMTIPKSVKSVAEGAFNGCTGLKEINVDKNNENYSSINGVFFNKDNTTLIKYPGEKADIKYTIPDSVTNLEERAFDGCTNLTSVNIPDNVMNIGKYTFFDCTNLKEINVNKNNKNYSSVNAVLFNKDMSILIRYPEGNNNIKYTIPNGVTSIGDYAFEDCTNLTNIEISDSVKSIEYNAFYGCINLKSMTIPDTVNDIVNFAIGYKNGSHCPVRLSNFTIYGTKGSEAENYANKNEFMFIDVSKLSKQKLIDQNTSISVYGNVPQNAKINVKNIGTDIKNAVLAYDITLTKDNKEIEPAEEVTVSIPYYTPNLKVVWLNDDEQINMNAIYIDGKYTFKTSHFSTYVLVENSLLGDTNGDGEVDIADALMISRYDAGLITLDEAQLSVSDVNKDGEVDIADALMLSRYDAGLIDFIE